MAIVFNYPAAESTVYHATAFNCNTTSVMLKEIPLWPCDLVDREDSRRGVVEVMPHHQSRYGRTAIYDKMISKPRRLAFREKDT